MDINKI